MSIKYDSCALKCNVSVPIIHLDIRHEISAFLHKNSDTQQYSYIIMLYIYSKGSLVLRRQASCDHNVLQFFQDCIITLHFFLDSK